MSLLKPDRALELAPAGAAPAVSAGVFARPMAETGWRSWVTTEIGRAHV